LSELLIGAVVEEGKKWLCDGGGEKEKPRVLPSDGFTTKKSGEGGEGGNRRRSLSLPFRSSSSEKEERKGGGGLN